MLERRRSHLSKNGLLGKVLGKSTKLTGRDGPVL
jgi:hypothetical protein